MIGGARGELFIGFRIASSLGKPRAFGFGLVQEHEQTHDSRGQGHRQRDQEARDGRVPAAQAPGMPHRGDAAGLDRTTFEPEAQVAGQGLGGSVASVRGFFQAGEADGFEVAGNPAVEPARGDGVLVADLVERLRARRSLKWWTACQQVVQERAQGIDIGGGTDRAGKGGHLLGGHVGRRPLGAVRPGLGRAGLAFEAGDAEVGNLGGDDVPGGSRLAVKQDVRRFQIEVKNPAGVEVSDGAGDGFGESGGIPRRERLRQSILERSSRHIFKDEP